MKHLTLLLDLDGTLVNSQEDICAIVNHLRNEVGLASRPREELIPCIGEGALNLMQRAIPEVKEEDHKTLAQRYRDLYLNRPHWGGYVYEGVAETLASLRRLMGVKIAIVTNKPTRSAEATLKHYLPEVRFDLIFGPEKVRAQKPSPFHLLDTLAALGRPADSAWFVGDSPVDRLSAEAAAIRFFAATYGFGRVEVAGHHKLTNFSQLLSFLEIEAGIGV